MFESYPSGSRLYDNRLTFSEKQIYNIRYRRDRVARMHILAPTINCSYEACLS